MTGSAARTLIAARFVARPNRFEVIASVDGPGEVRCHMGDPGRLKELLFPGAELRNSDAGPRGMPRNRPGACRATDIRSSVRTASRPSRRPEPNRLKLNLRGVGLEDAFRREFRRIRDGALRR